MLGEGGPQIWERDRKRGRDLKGEIEVAMEHVMQERRRGREGNQELGEVGRGENENRVDRHIGTMCSEQSPLVC